MAVLAVHLSQLVICILCAFPLTVQIFKVLQLKLIKQDVRLLLWLDQSTVGGRRRQDVHFDLAVPLLTLAFQAILPLAVALTDPDAVIVIKQQLSASLRPVARRRAFAVLTYKLVFDTSILGKDVLAISDRCLLRIINELDHVGSCHRVRFVDGVVPLVDA